MDDFGSKEWIKGNELQNKHPHLTHTINPSAGWTSDAECYYLIMELPGFKQDEVEVDVDHLGNLVITGSRLSENNEHVKFKRRLKLPEDSDMTKPVSGKLQNDMLYITVFKSLLNLDRFEFQNTSKEEIREEPENKDSKGERETKTESREEKIDKKTQKEKDSKRKRETKTEDWEEKIDDNQKEENVATLPESKEGKVDGEGKRKGDNVPMAIIKKLDQHRCIWIGILGFALGVFVTSHKLQQPSRG